MIRKILKGIERFFGSSKLALVLLVFVGGWSMLATVVPQGPETARAVAAWAASRGWFGQVASAIGLHQAFTAPAFLAAAILLAVSTAVCCWSRTRVSIARSRLLRSAARVGRESLAARHDREYPVASNTSDAGALGAVQRALAELGVRARLDGEVLRSVSRPWSVWGSPIFHWSLLLLMVAALAGILVRSEGLMPVAVGATVPDEPASYLSVNAGALHDWSRVHRSVRVDAFDPALVKDGIDRGAVPTVSVLDASGRVLVTQQVYANMKLHAGSLSINAPACGLAVTLAILDRDGRELRRVTQLVEFSQEATGGTTPLRVLAIKDTSGRIVFRLYATVPLDRTDGGGYGEWIPRSPSAHIVFTAADGTTLIDQVVREGSTAVVPGEGSVKVVGIGWYSLLSLVDDPTIPFVYGAMILAAVGLSLSVAAPQRLVVASVIGQRESRRLAIDLRLWRNNPAGRAEIESSIGRSLGIPPQGVDVEVSGEGEGSS